MELESVRSWDAMKWRVLAWFIVGTVFIGGKGLVVAVLSFGGPVLEGHMVPEAEDRGAWIIILVWSSCFL
jgi:hypothetical protein